MNGKEASVFRKTKGLIEGVLKRRGFEYLFIGPLTMRSLYARNVNELGERFMRNLVPISFPGYKEDLILTPEGTYPTVKFFADSGRKDAKIFYSEEFVRAEPFSEVLNGKTRAFWQIGFEIIGKSEPESRMELVGVLTEVMDVLEIPSVLRISDRRILQGLLDGIDVEKKELILRNLDLLQDDPESFRIDMKGIPVAGILADVLEISELPFSNMVVEGRKVLSGYPLSMKGLEVLERLFESLEPGELVVPSASLVIPKGFDAYTATIVEVLGRDSSIGALAGGGEYSALKSEFEDVPTMAGAGIGLSRITTILERGEKDGSWIS